VSDVTTTTDAPDPVAQAVAAALAAVPEGAEVIRIEGSAVRAVHCRYGDGDAHVIVNITEELEVASLDVVSGPTMPAGDPAVPEPEPVPEDADTGHGAT